MDFSASSLYGGQPAPQPTPTPSSSAGGQESIARTVPMPGALGATWANPTFLLVLLVGVAFALIHFSLDVKVSA
jgi:hypothetical protein